LEEDAKKILNFISEVFLKKPNKFSDSISFLNLSPKHSS